MQVNNNNLTRRFVDKKNSNLQRTGHSAISDSTKEISTEKDIPSEITNYLNKKNLEEGTSQKVLQNIKTLHDNGVSWEKIEKLILLSRDNADEAIELIINEKSNNKDKSYDELVDALIKAKQTVKQSGAGNQYDKAMENMLERTIFLEELGYSKDEIKQRLGESIEQDNKSGKITNEEYQHLKDLLANDELWNQFYEQVQQMVQTVADFSKIRDEKMLLEKQEQVEKLILNVNNSFANQNVADKEIDQLVKKEMFQANRQRFSELEKMLEQIKSNEQQLARFNQAQKLELARIEQRMSSTKEFLQELEGVMSGNQLNDSKFLADTLKKRADLGKQLIVHQDPQATAGLRDEISQREDLLRQMGQLQDKVFLAGEMFIENSCEQMAFALDKLS